MDYGQILRRAWQITWKYKFLWVFGIAIALCRGQGGGGGNFNFSNNFSNFSNRGGMGGDTPIPPEVLRQFEQFINSPAFVGLIIGLIVLILILTLLSIAVGAFARGALVRSVNRLEKGETMDFSGAWQEGKASFRPLFWFEFILNLPMLLIGLSILALIFFVFYNFLQQGFFEMQRLPDEVLQQFLMMMPVAVVGFCFLICLSVILQLLIAIFTVFGARAIALEGYGVTAAFGRAWQVFSKNLAPIILFALILFGISLVVGIVIAIPIAISVGIIVAVGIGAAVSGLWPLLIVLIVGMTTLIVLIASIVGGIYRVFAETLWTLVYRQLVGLVPKPSWEDDSPFGAAELTPP